VLYCLLRQGYIAALAPQGAPLADIVVSDTSCRRLCTIQVKSRRFGRSRGWVLKARHEQSVEGLFFCFVDIPEDVTSAPTVYVIPSEIVAEAVYQTHRKYLSQPGKHGQKKQDSDVRHLRPDHTVTLGSLAAPYVLGWLDPYRNRWDLLGLDSSPQVDPEAS